MKSDKFKFQVNDKVSIKGRAGVHVITYQMLIPIPTIVKGQFLLSETEMYKFITPKETYYAYGSDLKLIKKK